MKSLKIFILTMFIMFLFISKVSAQQVGKITALQGKVDILKGGKPPAVAAKVNEVVYLNDIVRTKTDSRAEITLNDGTVIKIAPRSRVDISEYFSDAESFKVSVNLQRGKIGAFVVKESVEKIKISPKTNKFEIKTPIVVAGVRGTNYIVSHYPTFSKIVVITGRVYCYNSRIPEIVVEISTGQSTIIREGRPPTPPKTLTPEEIQREQRDIALFMEEIEETQILKAISEPQIEISPYVKTLFANEKISPITETTEVTKFLRVDFLLKSIEFQDDKWKITYKIKANKEVYVKYRIINSTNWINVNPTAQKDVEFSIDVTGEYKIHIMVKDIYGKTRNWISYLSPISEIFSGDIVTDNIKKGCEGSVAGALGINKGVAKLTVLEPVSFSSFLEAGGESNEEYWILKGSTSSSSFRLITPTYLFKGTGPFVVNLENGYLKSITTEPWIETIKLNYTDVINGEYSIIYRNSFSETNANINAYLGGFWSKDRGSLYLIGKIIDNNQINFADDKGYIWLSPISRNLNPILYRGYIGGILAPKTDSSYNMNAYVTGIYSDSDKKGVFIGELSTDGSSNVLTNLKMFYLDGENSIKIITIKKGAIPTLYTPIPISELGIDENSYDIKSQQCKGYMVMDTDTNDYNFGVGVVGMGGNYSSAPSSPWEIIYLGKFKSDGVFGAILKGDTWGTKNNIKNLIHGKTYGYFSDVTAAKTGIFVGETAGTFDPTDKYWQTVTVGVALETVQFLSMACPQGRCNKLGVEFSEEQEKLRKLNIPVVEVGRANFTGEGNNLTVNMRDVVFFSTQLGQKPILWATAKVLGSYNGSPTLNQPITLNATSGASGSVNFTPTYWDSGKWSATVSGNPQLSGGSYSGPVNMQGVAAGNYNNNSFSGTASGVVK